MIIVSTKSISDAKFVQQSHKTPFYVRGVSKEGIPIGDHLVLVDGYYIYNQHTKKPVIKTPFKRLVHADAVARAIVTTYDEYLIILKDDDWSEYFFDIMRHTIDEGNKFADFINKLDNLYPNYVSWDNITDALR